MIERGESGSCLGHGERRIDGGRCPREKRAAASRVIRPPEARETGDGQINVLDRASLATDLQLGPPERPMRSCEDGCVAGPLPDLQQPVPERSCGVRVTAGDLGLSQQLLQARRVEGPVLDLAQPAAEEAGGWTGLAAAEADMAAAMRDGQPLLERTGHFCAKK